MKALTVCQPYAELIVSGKKRIENRGYPTKYHGALLIHAGKSRDWLDTWNGQMPEQMEFGAIIGVVEIVACVMPETILANKVLGSDPRYRDHASGPWCWLLTRERKFAKPIPYRGQQMIFNVPDEIVREALQS